MKRLVALVVAIAAGLVLVGLFLPSSAATVGSAGISGQSLNSDLSAIAGSPEYACFLSEERQLTGATPIPVLGAGTASARGGVYSTTFVDSWLTSMITDRVTSQVVDRRNLALTAADRAVGKSVLTRRITEVLNQYATDTEQDAAGCGGSGAAVLDSLPSWFVRQQSRNEAEQALLDARAAGAGLGKSAVAGYFRSHERTFADDCLSIIVVQTRKDATKVETALAGGSSFATEAATASLTANSAAQGGVAGCGMLAGSFLSAPVSSLSVGQTSTPFSGDGAYWVVQLTKRTPASFSSVRSTVLTAAIDAGQKRADAELTAALHRTTVSVDPRYGHVDPKHVTLVLPPTSPPASSVLAPSANTPAVTPASA